MSDEAKDAPDLHGTVPAHDIARLREQIDAVDDRILSLLNERAGLVRSVAEWKEENARPFYVPERERQVITRLSTSNHGPFPTEALRQVFAEIMSACLSLEQKLRVAYLGPEATFTHQAARTRFGLSARYLPVQTIAGVFAEVEKGAADLGVVPVENSTEGVVSHTLDNFFETPLIIQQEIALQVSHCLLARGGHTGDVKKVFSHPQALAQCRSWLAANLPGVPLIEVASTALAARLAKDDPEAGAVAAELAAQLYDLPIVRRRIEDEKVNVTRFLVVGHPPGSPDGHRAAGHSGVPTVEARSRPSGSDKTSVMFTLTDKPGGLYQALAPFAKHRVNMSRIESRPSRRRHWDYVFFIDLDGHSDDPGVANALEEFAHGCDLVKVLGSYPRAEPVSTPA